MYGLYAVAPAHLALGLMRLSLVGLGLTLPVVRGSIHPADQGYRTGEKAVTCGQMETIETLLAGGPLLLQEVSWTAKGPATLAAVPVPTPR